MLVIENVKLLYSIHCLWLDVSADGDVSKQEFDQGWRQEGFPNSQNAPLFFLELDRVPDEVLNAQDFPHIFHLFDEDGKYLCFDIDHT